MTKEIFIHPGMHKTGTTSIQNSFSAPVNQTILEENHLQYAWELGSNHSMPFNRFFAAEPMEHPLNSRLSSQELRELNRQFEEQMLIYSKQNNTNKLIFSGEDIGLLDEAEITNMHQRFEEWFGQVHFTIPIFTRNPLDFINSMYQTRVVSGRILDNFSKEKHPISETIYSAVISKFIRVFGRENVHVFSFEETLRHSSIHEHFFHILGADRSEATKLYVSRDNQSTCQLYGDFLFYLNQREPRFYHDPQDKGRLAYNPTWDSYDFGEFRSLKGNKYKLPVHMQERILERSAKDLPWLKGNFNIDYTNKVNKEFIQPPYIQVDIRDFAKKFPTMSANLRRLFKVFITEKYNPEDIDSIITYFKQNAI